MHTIHATCVRWLDCGWLLLGGSTAGKTDLALRMIDDGGVMVADDVVLIELIGKHVQARAPETGFGKIELRGQGIFQVDAIDATLIDQVVRCVPAKRQERLPEPEFWTYEGIKVPSVVVDATAASALARLRTVIRQERLV